MTVTLTEDQEKFVAAQVGSGYYKSPADVIAQSLGMLRAQEGFIRSNTGALRDKIAAGLECIRNGETIDGKTAIQDLREQLRQRQRGGQ